MFLFWWNEQIRGKKICIQMENESLRSEHCKRFEYQQTIEKLTHKNVERKQEEQLK